ncbi:hypothetical protein [Mesorhizobium sp. WSM2239]|uniref:Uncharacterized protein n=2 Tax=unclassified Mesorhizobium TaxID=325217 RepID=A0AAU8DEW1_9HYPH
MQIKIFEPATDDILTRADTDNMRLPFEHGWEQYLVTDDVGQILGVYDNFTAAADHRAPLAA